MKDPVEFVDDRADLFRRCSQQFPEHERRDPASGDLQSPADQFRVLLCGDLDIHPSGLGEEDERLPARPVDGDREIVLVLYVEPLFGKDLFHGQALDLLFRRVPVQPYAVCPAGHQDAAGLSPAADIHLCLQDKGIAQLAEMG
jgi:hypothetical protein